MWAWFMTLTAAAVVFVNWRRSGLGLLEFLALFFFRAYAPLWHGCVFNRPPLPEKGAALLVSNHTSSADPALLTCGIRRPVSFVIAQEFYRVPLLGYFFVKHGYVPVLRDGRDVCLLGLGTMVATAQAAADLLAAQGISAKVVSMHTVKPLDDALLADSFARYGVVAVLEEHSRIGGLASAIGEWLVAKNVDGRALMEFGTPDEFFREAGSQQHARERFGLTAPAIAQQIAQRLRK